MEMEQFSYVQEEVDIQHYLYLLRRHFKILLAVMVIALSLAAIYAYKLPDLYESSSQLLIQKEQEPTAYAELKDQNAVQQDAIYYNTQIELIRNPKLIENAIQDNNLLEPLLALKKIKVTEDLQPDRAMRIAVGIVLGDLSIRRIRDTQIFIISYSGPNKVLCREVANAIARAYVKQALKEKLYMPKELLQFFPEDAQNVQLQTPYGQLQDVSKQEIAGTLPSVVNDPLIRQLQTKAAEAEAELIRLKETYKKKHPKVIQAKANLKFIQDRIKIEQDNIVRNLKTSLASKLQVNNVRVLREAVIPTIPTGPKRFTIILLAGLGAFVVTAGFIFLIDYLDDTIKSQEDVEKFVQLPFLGLIPAIKKPTKEVHQKAFWVHYNSLSDIAESFRMVKVSVNFSGAPGSLKCLLITSCVPAEGKSLFSSNLASCFLRDSEKVLLVDGDVRHPTVHLVAGAQNLTGLTNYLTSNIDFSEIIQKTAIEGLDIVAAGALSPNPMELFSSYRMENFIREAKEKYDRVIIDSPPVSGLADSLVIGTKVDGVVLLIDSRRISRNIVKKVKQRLMETGMKLLGVVLNRVDMDRDEPSYRYYAYSQRYYGRKHQDFGKKEDGKDATSKSS
ncbi:MAG TPA: polysaccharide biosynthesis tyrosine autokinase [Candidatus Omnitrophota bacterium]|nr:polysaccharide biosynthesis tyrosine autokinase [Candidatus Omnitrophota bacterium]